MLHPFFMINCGSTFQGKNNVTFELTKTGANLCNVHISRSIKTKQENPAPKGLIISLRLVFFLLLLKLLLMIYLAKQWLAAVSINSLTTPCIYRTTTCCGLATTQGYLLLWDIKTHFRLYGPLADGALHARG